MEELAQAAGVPAIRELIDSWYAASEVEGFAFGVHAAFVSMYRGEVERAASAGRALQTGKIPSGWSGACKESGFPEGLSPIYAAVYVNRDESKFRGQLPKVVGNHAIIVERIEPAVALADRYRHRPIEGGISTGTVTRPLAGTLGGFLKDVKTGAEYILSCGHVLGSSGDDVVQQGRADGGTSPADSVGDTRHVIPLKTQRGFRVSDPYNDVDAALAEVRAGVAIHKTVRLLGAVTTVAPKANLAVGDEVVFVGKESDYQEAYIHAFILRQKVTIDGAVYNFGDVFEIRPRRPLYVSSLAKTGDSGSWVVRDTGPSAGEATGMLFAGNGKVAWCCYMETIVSALGKASGATLAVA